MRLISLLNHYQHFPGFVYERARHCASSQTIEIAVRPRRGSRPVCSGCDKPAPAYDHLKPRRFEFVPLWGCMAVGPFAVHAPRCHRTPQRQIARTPCYSANSARQFDQSLEWLIRQLGVLTTSANG
jgi:transposase